MVRTVLLPSAIVMLLFAVGSGHARATDDFHLTTDAPYLQAVRTIWADRPSDPCAPEAMRRWLVGLMVHANLARWYPLAEAAAREAVTRWPTDAPSWQELAWYAGKQGKYLDAIKACRAQQELQGQDQRTALALAVSWLWASGHRDQITAIQEDLATLPEPGADKALAARLQLCRILLLAISQPQAPELKTLITTFAQTSSMDDAHEYLQREIYLDPLRELPWFVAIVGATAVGTPPTDAIRPLPVPAEEQAMLDALPHQARDQAADRLMGQAMVAVSKGQWQDGLDCLAHIAQRPPESLLVESLARAGLDDATGSMQALRAIDHAGIDLSAWVYHAGDCYSLTMTVCDLLSTAVATDATKKRPLALALIVKSSFMWTTHDGEQAIALLNQAHDLDPTLADVLNTRGVVYDILQRPDQAAADYQAAEALRNDYADAWYNLSFVAERQGQLPQAMSYLDHAQTLGDTDAMSQCRRAELLARQGRITESVGILESLAASAPPRYRHLPDALWLTAVYAIDQKHLSDAEHLVRLIVRIDPEVSDAWIRLAGILDREGRFQDAIDATAHVRCLDTLHDTYAQQVTAIALAQLGQRDQARAIMKQMPATVADKDQTYFQMNRAYFGAVMGNEALLMDALRFVVEHPNGSDHADPAARSRWLRTDAYFDAYRAKPWFQALIRQASPPPAAAATP